MILVLRLFSIIVILLVNVVITFRVNINLSRFRLFRQFNADEGSKFSDGTELQRGALSILDCLTSPRDETDPQYDVEKDVRRDEILANNDYNTLKVELRTRGLRTSGDKLEMITRLLLHIIDPSIKFNEM